MAESVKFEFGNHSDVGQVRKANEDYFGSASGEFGDLFIVCDGMGGYKGGRVASTTAVEAIQKHFKTVKKDADLRIELFNSLKLANKEIVEKADVDDELGKMGSTAVVALLHNTELYFAHIGDSRIYRVRDDVIERLTRDHSLVQEMVDNGIINEEQAEAHPQKNVILRSLGPNGNSEPQVDPRDEVLFKDDYIILCSDGLTGHVEDFEIKETVLKYPPQQACIKLVEMANERGGKDNITVQVIKITDGKKRATSLRDMAKLKQAAIVAAVAFVVLILWYALSNFNQEIKIIAPVQDTTKTVKRAPANIEEDSSSTVGDDKNGGADAAKKPLKDPKGNEKPNPQN
jgi:serine/threonine protein phosphatase PrpC